MITLRKELSTKETFEKLKKVNQRLEKEKIADFPYSNFIRRHLIEYFKVLHMRMPDIRYNIQFADDVQTIRVSCMDVSWTVINEGNTAFYYLTEDTYAIPSDISLAIFGDLINMHNWGFHLDVLFPSQA